MSTLEQSLKRDLHDVVLNAIRATLAGVAPFVARRRAEHAGIGGAGHFCGHVEALGNR